MKANSLLLVFRFCLLGSLLYGVIPLTAQAQSTGDYRSRSAQMNWESPSDWEIFDGSAWNTATDKPGALSNVFIQNGHTVSLTRAEACQDLHLSTGLTTATNGTDAKLALQDFVLEVNGKIRAYFAPIGTVPGTSAGISGDPITINPGSNGKLRFVGDSRNITNTGEWSALSTAYPTTFAIEINMNPGQTAYLNTVVKASSWQILSGTLDAGDNRVSVDNGTDNIGDFYVAAGAVFRSAKSGTGNHAVVSRGSTTNGGSMVVDGTLVLTGASPTVGMKTVLLNGVVEYARPTTQKFLAGINGGETPLVYHHIKLTGAGSKTTVPDAVTELAEGATLEIGGELQPATFALGTNGRLAASAPRTRLIYNGKVAQTTATEWNSDFSEIIIDNTAGVSLNAAKQVDNKLVFMKGILNTTPTRSLTIGPAGEILGTNERNYISGPLTRMVASILKTDLAFPVGKDALYKPMALTVTQSSDVATKYTAELFNTAPTTRNLPANDLDKVSSIRYFKLTKGSGGSPVTQASVTIFYGADDAVTDAGNLRIARSSASNWLNVGGSGEPMVNGAGSITSDVNFTTLGDFVLANAKGGGNVLPVTMVYFDAASKAGKVNLKWQTTCETNSDRFEVEKSADGLAFEKLGAVKAAGTSSELKNYTFEDVNPATGTTYYRLKQVDLDGSFAYSRIVTVNTTIPKPAVTVYPNPTSENIYIQAPGFGSLRVEISNASGRVVLSENIPVSVLQAKQPISISHLPAGVYQVVLTGNTDKQSIKLMKQ